MLNRWLAMKEEERGKPKKKRPYLASLCTDLNDCLKWRQELVSDIGKKVAEIQNASLGEYKIRALNDEINKLFREKGHWERQIKQLGGANYSTIARTLYDSNVVKMYKGYMYFGAAKDLPGVKELFEEEYIAKEKKTKKEIYQGIDADYYGYGDDEDGLLEAVEGPAEKKARDEAIAAWVANREQEAGDLQNAPKSLIEVIEDEDAEEEEKAKKEGATASADALSEIRGSEWKGPSEEDIEKAVLERKKQALLQQYVSPELQAQAEKAKALMNK